MHKSQLHSSRLRLIGRGETMQGRNVQPHYHPLIELVYYLKGEILCRIGDEVVECRPGMLRMLPPGVVHGELSLTAWSCYYIWIDAPQLPVWPHMYLDDSAATFGNLCGALMREWNQQSPDRSEMIDLLLNQADLLLRRASAQPEATSGERLVRAAEQCFKERFVMPLTVAEVAAHLGVSASYLRTLFVQLRNQTPSSFLQALRIEHASALIRNSDLSLEAIARLSGYDSASHLSRHIKRALGMTPGALRCTGHEGGQ